MCRDIREDGITQVSLSSSANWRKNQVSDIIDSDLHECYNVREDGITQVSLSPPDKSGGSGFRYY
jgi:hypothetical protein